MSVPYRTFRGDESMSPLEGDLSEEAYDSDGNLGTGEQLREVQKSIQESYTRYGSLSDTQKELLWRCLLQYPEGTVKELWRDPEDGCVYVVCKIIPPVREAFRRDKVRARNVEKIKSIGKTRLATPRRTETATATAPTSRQVEKPRVPDRVREIRRSRVRQLHHKDGRSLLWTKKLCTRIFESRLSSLEHEVEEEETQVDFASFVLSYLNKNFGLEHIVKETSLDLIRGIHEFETVDFEVAIFSLFMQGKLEHVHLVFYLMARNHVFSQKEAKIETRGRNMFLHRTVLPRVLRGVFQNLPYSFYRYVSSTIISEFEDRKEDFLEINELLYYTTLKFASQDVRAQVEGFEEGEMEEEYEGYGDVQGALEELSRREVDEGDQKESEENVKYQDEEEEYENMLNLGGGEESPADVDMDVESFSKLKTYSEQLREAEQEEEENLEEEETSRENVEEAMEYDETSRENVEEAMEYDETSRENVEEAMEYDETERKEEADIGTTTNDKEENRTETESGADLFE